MHAWFCEALADGPCSLHWNMTTHDPELTLGRGLPVTVDGAVVERSNDTRKA
jgi:hypothetical protein